MTTPSNTEFLKALLAPDEFIGRIPDNAVQWVCNSPSNSNQWRGRPYKDGDKIEYTDQNTFFSISMYRPVNGKIKRNKANFAAMLCVVLDDVGTKAEKPELPPSWIIETSPGNAQWGYILRQPITKADTANNIIKALAKAGYTDQGAGGPTTRYMRLPVGSNWKEEHVAKNNGKPVPHKVVCWQPKRWFSLAEITSGLNLDIQENKPQAGQHKTVAQSADLQEIRDMLRYIHPDRDRDTWIKIGMAIHHETEGSQEGFALWDEWSAGNVY